MDVFISWSGPRSRAIAEGLREWLPTVVGTLKPWISSEDIDKGARWAAEIAGQLSASKVGIFCLTPENLESRWLNFEAGAISKHPTETSHVCTYLYGLTASGVGQPLSQFQATIANKDDTKKMLFHINRISDQPAADTALERTFDALWPDFEQVLDAVAEMEAMQAIPEPRESGEVLEEIASGVKSLLGRPPNPSPDPFGPGTRAAALANPFSTYLDQRLLLWRCQKCKTLVTTHPIICTHCGRMRREGDEGLDPTPET